MNEYKFIKRIDKSRIEGLEIPVYGMVSGEDPLDALKTVVALHLHQVANLSRVEIYDVNTKFYTELPIADPLINPLAVYVSTETLMQSSVPQDDWDKTLENKCQCQLGGDSQGGVDKESIKWTKDGLKVGEYVSKWIPPRFILVPK